MTNLKTDDIRPPHPARRSGISGRRRRGAFTLVELLVVIGIIALLISILLPALNRARDAANRTACLSNVRQLAIAFVMYSDAHKGYFPYSSPLGIPNPKPQEDWLHWQTGRNVDDSAIAPYIGKFTEKVFICPSDDVNLRPVFLPSDGPYKYSYTLSYLVDGYRRFRMTRARNSAEKIFLAEEDYTTVNDGLWSPITFTGGNASVPGFDWLAIHHDRPRKTPDVPTASDPIPNPDRRGNAAFLDGHAEYIERSYAHDRRNVIPELR